MRAIQDELYDTPKYKSSEKKHQNRKCTFGSSTTSATVWSMISAKYGLIGDGVKVYHMAVLSSPSGKFRWANLYTNQKKAVFMDSHIKFFEMMGGCYREVVYDNMRNVVKKFIGKTSAIY